MVSGARDFTLSGCVQTGESLKCWGLLTPSQSSVLHTSAIHRNILYTKATTLEDRTSRNMLQNDMWALRLRKPQIPTQRALAFLPSLAAPTRALLGHPRGWPTPLSARLGSQPSAIWGKNWARVEFGPGSSHGASPQNHHSHVGQVSPKPPHQRTCTSSMEMPTQAPK